MTHLEVSEPRLVRRPSFTLGGFALFIDAILCLAAWTALERQIFLVPPFFLFLTLDHPLFLALLTLVICAIEYAVDRNSTRAVLLVLAILLLLVAASHVHGDAGKSEQYLDGGNFE